MNCRRRQRRWVFSWVLEGKQFFLFCFHQSYYRISWIIKSQWIPNKKWCMYFQNESPRVCCPLCRKETTYVKVFEDLQTSQVRQSESRGTRKRVTDEDSRRETISVHQKQRKFVISCQNNLNSQSQARPNLPIQLLVSTLESRSLLPRSPLDPRSISLYRDNSDESPPAPHWHTLADELYDESPYLDLDE